MVQQGDVKREYTPLAISVTERAFKCPHLFLLQEPNRNVVNTPLPSSRLIMNIIKKAFLPAHQAPSLRQIKTSSQAPTSRANLKQYKG